MAGGELADDVTMITNSLSGMIESAINMDPAVFSGIVGGLETIAAAGPALLVAGGAIKAISVVGSHWPVALALGLIAAADGLERFQKAVYADQFGDMQMDQNTIGAYLDSLSGGFTAAEAEISKYNQAVEKAINDYAEASSTMTESLVTKMLTNAQITDEDYNSLLELGQKMQQAVIEGIRQSNTAAEKGLEWMAAGGGMDTGMYDAIIATMEIGMQSAIDQATALGGRLRQALMDAISNDGKISPEEMADIRNYINQLNELMAMEAEVQKQIATKRMLRKAQSLGLDATDQIQQMVQDQIDAQKEAAEEAYEAAYARTAYGADMMIKTGQMAPEEKANQLAELDRAYNEQQAGIEAGMLPFLASVYSEAASGSTLSDVWNNLGIAADSYLDNGKMTRKDLEAWMGAKGGQKQDVLQFLNDFVKLNGGEEGVFSAINTLASMGDIEGANALSRMMTMYSIAKATGEGNVLDQSVNDAEWALGKYNNADTQTRNAWDSIGEAAKNGDGQTIENVLNSVIGGAYQDAVKYTIGELADTYDLSKVPVADGLTGAARDAAAAWALTFDTSLNAEDYRINVTPDLITKDLRKLPPADLPVDADTSNIPAEIESAVPDSVTVTIDAVAGDSLTGSGKKTGGGLKNFAEGGRADEASIFGEAGPEWAIPEEHSAKRQACWMRQEKPADSPGGNW